MGRRFWWRVVPSVAVLAEFLVVDELREERFVGGDKLESVEERDAGVGGVEG